MLPVVLLLAAVAGPVSLAQPRPLLPSVDAFPRIARPATPAQVRINAAVARLDAKVRVAARECIDNGGPFPGTWERTVAATMRGPAFLSFLYTDDYYCGGAHPDVGHGAIVYDLATGAPVAWTTLLGRRLTGVQALTSSGDGVNVVTLSSPRLTALYRQRYRSGQDDKAVDDDCVGAIEADADGGPIALIAWLDAKAGGLALQYDLPHAIQACSAPVVIPAAVLAREGASPRLVRALTAARSGR